MSAGDRTTTSTIFKMLELLDDGRWHTLNDILSKIELDRSRQKKVIKFLKEYNFIILDENEQRVRLDTAFRKLLFKHSTV